MVPAQNAPGVHHAIIDLSYGRPPALGRRDGSAACRRIISGGSLQRRFLFSGRQPVDYFLRMRPRAP